LTVNGGIKYDLEQEGETGNEEKNEAQHQAPHREKGENEFLRVLLLSLSLLYSL
jgi:hypothetical protein